MSYDPAHNRYDCRALSQKCHGLSSFKECHQTSVIVFEMLYGQAHNNNDCCVLKMSWIIVFQGIS
jgi:hypothetical protein